MSYANKYVIRRDSNIEILRIVLILFVITLHYNYEYIFGDYANILNGFKKQYTFFIEALCICAVNIFMLISGYFQGSKNKMQLRKIIILFIEVIICNIIGFIMEGLFFDKPITMKNIISCFLPRDYFVWLYCTVYFFSPFINFLLNKLNKKQLFQLFSSIVVIFFLIPTITDFFIEIFGITHATAISPISQNGNGNGYTFVNFLSVYMIGYIIYRCKEIINYKKIFPLLFILSTIMIAFFSHLSIHAFDYCNILVLLQSISIFLFFLFNKKLNSNLINYISSFVFEIYLIHPIYIKMIKHFFNTKNFLNDSNVLFIIKSQLMILLIFVLSLITAFIFKYIIKIISYILLKIHFLSFELTIE